MLRNSFFFASGVGFLALSKIKNAMRGYSTPKPFDTSDSEKCIAYDLKVVEDWLQNLAGYTNEPPDLSGKNVLDLGPGSDLGVGISLLAKGCGRYHAFDVNDLMKETPDSFYEELFDELERMEGQTETDHLRLQLKNLKDGGSSALSYIVSKDFDLASAFDEPSIDLVFSQAAFEHFDDIEATAAQLSAVCKPGAILIAEVDLQTHSRWIRDKDPNNIYRYPDFIYRAFWFRGIPNRVRPFQYKAALERNGWTDVTIIPQKTASPAHSTYSGMHAAFSDDANQMDYLTVTLCARRMGDDRLSQPTARAAT